MNYNTPLPPFKWFILENFPYIEDDFDALTNWQLFCKLGKEMNKIIEKTNLTGEQVEQLTNAFTELQNYVNNYFDNLDVQEEINTKLDEMAESGELENIIAQYLTINSILAFDNINDLKNADYINEGTFVETYGYYEKGDGGSAKYKVREIINTDVIDNEKLLALDNENLVAELMLEDSLTPEQIGAKGDGSTDDSTKILHAMQIATEYKVPLQLVGQYKIDSAITFTTGALVMRGSKAQVPTLIAEVSSNQSNLIFGENGSITINGVANVTFENIAMTGSAKGTGKAIILRAFKNKIINCSFNSFDIVISTEQGTNWTGENQIVNCTFTNVNKCIVLNHGSDSDVNGCLVSGTCNYFITGGSDAGFKIENNHDYSTNGSDLGGYAVTFVGNYVDGWNKLRFSGNSGFNITGNTFIGNFEEGDTSQKYAIKFSATTIVSGNICGNMLSSSDNNIVYDNLCFIDLTDNTYFANVTISGNNCRIAKDMFKGESATKNFYTNIEQNVKCKCSLVNSNATIQTENVILNGNCVIAHTSFNLNSIYNGLIARLPNICDYWIHCVKMDNSDTYWTYIGNREIRAQGAWAQATSMEVFSIGVRYVGNYPQADF